MRYKDLGCFADLAKGDYILWIEFNSDSILLLFWN